jgi:hypothetical protein
MNIQYEYFIPRTDAELALWAANLHLKIPTVALMAGLPSADITEVGDASQALLEAVNKCETKKMEQQEAVEAKELCKETNLAILQAIIGRLKRMPLYTSNMGRELGIIGSSFRLMQDEVKPVIKLSVTNSGVKIGFNKKGMPAIALYTRIKGTGNWELLSIEEKSPYVDTRATATAGVPDIREYRAQCRTATREVGISSSIEEIVYGG